MIKWIAFDADDTLWENEKIYTRVQKELGEIMQPYLNGTAVESVLYEVEKENIPLYGYGIKSFGLSALEMAIKQSAGKIPVSKIQQILDLIRSMAETPTMVLPGVKETLQTLQTQYPLFIITKGDLLDQERKLRSAGLGDYFEFMEVVSEKTSKTYAKLFERLNINPTELLMIGNSLKSDVLPPVELGAVGVYLEYEYTWEHEKVDLNKGLPQYYTLKTIAELPALIDTINHTV